MQTRLCWNPRDAFYGSPRVHSSSFSEQLPRFPVEESPLPHGEVDQRLGVF